MPQQRDEYLLIGRIVGLFGIKGWVKIESYTDPREQIEQYTPWRVSLRQQHQELEVEAVQRQGKGLAAKLKGVGSREAAADLIGGEISIQARQLPELEEGELYWQDLIGLSVVSSQGELLGQVDSLFETGANDVLVVSRIKDGKKQELLIPYLPDQVILSVDTDKGEMTVDWESDF